MRRLSFLTALGGLAALTASFALLRPGPSAARPQQGGAAQDSAGHAPAQAQLPIARVVLYSSGVGYFQREGTVEGDARVDLAFPTQEINDLLKSMVLRDLDGGQVSAVAYDSAAPIERTLHSFALDLTTNPGLADLLNQARGEKVEIALVPGASGQPGSLSGTVVGIEKQRQPAGKDATVEVALLNLWCSDGLRSVKLGDVQRLRFLNPVLDGELSKALEILARSHDAQKKAVSIRFAGSGRRNVRVSYVVESPIWKTSYRLVLDSRGGQPFLQGWATVDNPSDEDWRDVRMALVSGRPISFRMDLYTPLYVPRPLVEPELFASLRPPSYSGAMGPAARPEAADASPPPAPMTGAPSAVPMDGLKFGGMAGRRDMARKDTYSLALREELGAKMDLAQGVRAAATAAQLGESFQYVIDHPVTLPRQKSALLPIVSHEVEATRVSIYNESVQAQFPLLGLKFRNTSGAHLMQGPITVFEGSAYAGDARIQDLQPNEERLLSFAIDLGTEVKAEPRPDSGRLVEVKAVKGLLYTTTRMRQGRTYTARNRSGQERLLLIEHPVRPGFTLVDTARPVETARDVYRFELKVSAGQTESLTVTEEQTIQQAIQLSNSPDDQIRQFLQSPVLSDKMKQGLEQALKLRLELADTQRELGEEQRQLQQIKEDQTRLRANLKEMPPTARAYKRYLEKFDSQETQIEALQSKIKKLQAQEAGRRKQLDDFLANLTAE